MAIALSSCDFRLFELRPGSRGRIPETGDVDTYIPTYAKEGTAELTVNTLAPQPTQKAGKIFVMGNKLFQVEENAGLHIIDYSDKGKPVKLAFLNVPGCKEVALKGNNVFTNNFDDMLVLDLSAYPDVKVKSRIPYVFPELRDVMPPRNTGIYYMECIDHTKGRVVKWEVKKVNISNKCYVP